MGADFSPCKQYRYLLWREWTPLLPPACFILLNPSTADSSRDDPTIRRCIGLSKSQGFGSSFFLNAFALRSTSPKNLYQHGDPIGPENDSYIKKYCKSSSMVFVGWGAHGKLHNRQSQVLSLLSNSTTLYCFAINKGGTPRHPLYLRGDAKPMLFG